MKRITRKNLEEIKANSLFSIKFVEKRGIIVSVILYFSGKVVMEMSAKTRKKQNKNEKNKQEIDSDTMDFSG